MTHPVPGTGQVHRLRCNWPAAPGWRHI